MLHQLLNLLLRRECSDEDERIVFRVGSVGAWVGQASFHHVERDLDFAQSTGLSRIDVILNDHSRWREARDFDTYPLAGPLKLIRAAKRRGMEVHVMSWVMPHPKYISGMATFLNELIRDEGIESVCLDAEEPWTQAEGRIPYDKAAEQVLHSMQVPWGVTGIGYAPIQKLGPLARAASYYLPQCYSTASNSLDPATAAPKLSRRWRNLMKLPDSVRLVVGLAAYRQSGRGMMTTAFHAAESCEPDSIVYWSLRWIRKSRSVAKALKELTKRA